MMPGSPWVWTFDPLQLAPQERSGVEAAASSRWARRETDTEGDEQFRV